MSGDRPSSRPIRRWRLHPETSEHPARGHCSAGSDLCKGQGEGKRLKADRRTRVTCITSRVGEKHSKNRQQRCDSKRCREVVLRPASVCRTFSAKVLATWQSRTFLEQFNVHSIISKWLPLWIVSSGKTCRAGSKVAFNFRLLRLRP